VRHAPHESWLLRGRDGRKDQAYFLWGLPAALLPRLRFPLGELTKPEVREKARALGLVTADKPESQEICFVPSGDYRDLLRRRLPARHPALEPGALVTEDGRVVGRHEGYAGYTVGQRRGLGGGATSATSATSTGPGQRSGEPLYVLEIRPETREVVVGPKDALAATAVEIGDLNWLCPPPAPGESVRVQLRHRAPAASTTVLPRESGRGDVLRLGFHEPQGAVTPGQSAVVFRGDRVLGGGRIRRSLRAGSVDVVAEPAAVARWPGATSP
jgi:tRNA-specific 2-thiouridylase